VSGEYTSQLGTNAARHVRSIMSRELASLTLGDAGAALLLERAPAGSAGISACGFTTVAEHSRLCLAYPMEGAHRRSALRVAARRFVRADDARVDGAARRGRSRNHGRRRVLPRAGLERCRAAARRQRGVSTTTGIGRVVLRW
jgi:hypothetical protein